MAREVKLPPKGERRRSGTKAFRSLRSWGIYILISACINGRPVRDVGFAARDWIGNRAW